MNWLNPYYGSLFSSFLSTCVWSLLIPMVEMDQYFGLLKVSLQRLWHLLTICLWIQLRSLWLDVTFAPLVPVFWDITWLGASNVCTSFRCLYTLCYKIPYISTTLQAMKIMLLCGIHLHSRYSIGIYIYYFIIYLYYCVVCREFL